MTAENFCYWLQGFFELKGTIDHREGATPETMKMIEDHLQLVLRRVAGGSGVPNFQFPVQPFVLTGPTC